MAQAMKRASIPYVAAWPILRTTKSNQAPARS
jgi:hypothetical protein